MSRFRLYPTPQQAVVMTEHCAHARYVWNLAVEQLGYRSQGQRVPGYAEQNQQLTEARRVFDWLGAGSVTVQQQALRDFHQAMSNWRAGTHRRPAWRKRGRHEGFRVVGAQALRVERVNRRWSRVLIPKVGWVRLRRSRDVPDARSYRVTLDRAGRWHIAFAAVPDRIAGPGDGAVVGIDRGVAVTLALSDGAVHEVPTPRSTARLQRKLCRAKRGSNRRAQIKTRLARLHARNRDARKDFVEKASTQIARAYDLIRIEDLRVANMTRSARGTVETPGRSVRAKAGLNRSILTGGWSLFATRLEHKAPGRVEKVDPAFTSQRCSGCGHVDANSRQSQALFVCTACGMTSNADLNAARNIAAGHAVTARGGLPLGGPVNREPHDAPSPGRVVGSSPSHGEVDVKSRRTRRPWRRARTPPTPRA
ncbi:MAG: RNA-guided endonuclease InsQ/TnpB family protein [Pseudonocardiaceae bacterium]